MTKEAAAALWPEYLVEYGKHCEKLENVCIEWSDQGAAGESVFQMQFLAQSLRPLLEERLQISQRFHETLSELLGITVMKQLESRDTS